MTRTVAELEEALAKAEALAAMPIPIKLGNKRNVVVGSGGWLGQRFPVTLYAPSWRKLLQPENVKAILDFIDENEDQLSWES
jgi:hypothetical protein